VLFLQKENTANSVKHTIAKYFVSAVYPSTLLFIYWLNQIWSLDS